MEGSIYLGGGGSEADEANLWGEVFIPGATVAVWPFAQRTHEGRRASIDWMETSLATRGSFTIDGWLSPDADHQSLLGADIVAVPGGNTFDLLHALRTAGLLSLLEEHLARGGSFYGGSAGAVVAGADVGIALTADPNHVGLGDTRGLDLAGGCDILPHYTDGQESTARAHLGTTGRPVLCLPESSGVVLVAGTARNVGPSEVKLVTETATRAFPADEAIPLTSIR